MALFTAPDGRAVRSRGGDRLLRRAGRTRLRQALRPLREFGPPALDMVRPMPYVAVQQLIDDVYPARAAQLLDR